MTDNTTLVADGLRALIHGRADLHAVRAVLDKSPDDHDIQASITLHRLGELGFDPGTRLKLLAFHKSAVKYRYVPEIETLHRLVSLSESGSEDLKVCFKRPFLLVKTAWLWEHAPFFHFRDTTAPTEIDALVTGFARKYRQGYIESREDWESWTPQRDPRRVRRTVFWENAVLDPVKLIRQTQLARLEGLEISVDFHPFNPCRLLPEEIDDQKRHEIREAAARAGVRIDIHSPIIGPYIPSPDPAKGKQSFFAPGRCHELQMETVWLARAIGAEAVVVHLIEPTQTTALVKLIEAAAGSDLKVAIENYCQLKTRQTSAVFLETLDAVRRALPPEIWKRNLAVTLDVGHLNIEEEDPLVGARKIGQWCREYGVSIRMHATDNYGPLLYGPPHFSADVHGDVSGRGINNALIIQLLRSMGLRLNVVAEQIKPLSPLDIETIHGAQTSVLDKTLEAYAEAGRSRLAGTDPGPFLADEFESDEAYQFVAGLNDLNALREYAVYRRIQDKKHLSVDEARRISQDFMRMPEQLKSDLTAYIDDLLLPIQTETGAIQKTQLDLICQNINGTLFWTVGSQQMNRIFSAERVFRPGAIVCRQGGIGAEMFLVKEGIVDVFIDKTRVATLEPGEVFGEMSLFYNIPRSATVKAASSQTRLGMLTRDDLTHLLEERQPFVYDLIYRLYSILPQRLRNMNEKYRSAIEKLQMLSGEVEKTPASGAASSGFPGWQEYKILPTFSTKDMKTIRESTRRLKAGEVVFEEGAEADGLYFVDKGRVRAMVRGANGKLVELGEIRRGEVLGEMALIDDKPRSATVEAVTDCTLSFASKRVFQDFIRGRSDFAFRLMASICLSILRRILHLDRIYSEIKSRNRDIAQKRSVPPPRLAG